MYTPDSPYDLARKLVPYFQSRQSNNGFFIEAGAANGVWQSNTLYLETTLGWSGLLIEPNKHCFEICKETRQMKGNIFYNCALVGFDYKKNYIEGYFDAVCAPSGHPQPDYEDALMGRIQEDNPRFEKDKRKRWERQNKIKVSARKLSDILDENNITKIDFFSLDVEGYELHALNGLDFSRHSPTWICVECFGSVFRDVKQKLEINGYILKAMVTECDFLFEKIR